MQVAQWNVQIQIKGRTINVADYYLPVSVAEYIAPTGTFFASPEDEGARNDLLDAQKTWVRYSDWRVSDGKQWYPINHWTINFKDDADVDQRFGWRADDSGLTSSSGHPEDAVYSFRDPGTMFAINVGLDCTVAALPSSALAFSALSTPLSLDIKPANGCFWGTESNAGWVLLTPLSALDVASLVMAPKANPYPYDRLTTVRVGTQTHAVQQAGWASQLSPPPVDVLPSDFLSGDFTFEGLPDFRRWLFTSLRLPI